MQYNNCNMNLQNRIDLLIHLSKYLDENNEEWLTVKKKASIQNGWFTPEFIDLAVQNISASFLQPEKLTQWAAHYHLDDNVGGKNIGIVMAGNIPLVGFHDFLCVFISGHKAMIKPSSKDEVLIKHIAEKFFEWNEESKNFILFAGMLKSCDAYITTGSNNSSRYFEYYFGKYPNIIRCNRTSVAVLDGNETQEELSLLTDDIQ